MRRGSANISLSVINLTQIAVSVSLQDHASARVLVPQCSATLAEVSAVTATTLTLAAYIKSADCNQIRTYQLRRRMPGGRKWEVLACDAEPLWRVYRVKISKGHHRVVIMQDRCLDSWMHDLPDSISLANVLLPGTHETMALYGWPFSQCQDLTLEEQLNHGIRLLDIRIILYKGQLVAYHGATPERASFKSILSTVCNFLRSPNGRNETVVMSIMEEDSFLPSSPLFSSLVHDAVLNPPSSREMWYLENRVPKLGEVRGKIVLFSRFGKNGEGWEGGLNGLGIHPPIWPDSRREGFEWELEKTRVRTQDWYGIPSFLSIPEKFAVAVEMLHPKPAPKGKEDLAITYFSAARVPLALPSTVACGFGWSRFMLGLEGVNSRAGRWILRRLADDGSSGVRRNRGSPVMLRKDTQETLVDAGGTTFAREKNPEQPEEDVRLRGWVLMDFIQDPYELAVIPLLIECNWRGRVDGEDGLRDL